jgi:hypothetical protein
MSEYIFLSIFYILGLWIIIVCTRNIRQEYKKRDWVMVINYLIAITIWVTVYTLQIISTLTQISVI